MLPGFGRLPLRLPCCALNGLLPGFGGRGMPMPWLDANGLLPGRGPEGLGAPGLAAPGFGAEPPGFGASDPGFGAEPLDLGAVPPGFGAEDPLFGGVPPGFGAVLPGLGGEDGFASPVSAAGFADFAGGFGPGFAPGFGALLFFSAAPDDWASPLWVTPSASSAAFTFRATGGATADELALTNSPISFSLARTTLLSTPISEAISCTRGFATFLLSGFTPDRREPKLSDGPHFEPLISYP